MLLLPGLQVRTGHIYQSICYQKRELEKALNTYEVVRIDKAYDKAYIEKNPVRNIVFAGIVSLLVAVSLVFFVAHVKKGKAGGKSME